MRAFALAGMLALASMTPSIACAQDVQGNDVVDLLMRAQPTSGTNLVISQTPPSPVKIGTKGIRFHVSSKTAGYVALLDIAQDFSVTLLYPNQFTAVTSPDGPVRPGQTITVPDDAYFGGRVPENAGFGAPEVTSGRIMAIFSDKRPEYPSGFATRRGLKSEPQGKVLIQEVASAFGLSVSVPPPPGLSAIFFDPPYLVGDFKPSPLPSSRPGLLLPNGVATQFMLFQVVP